MDNIRCNCFFEIELHIEALFAFAYATHLQQWSHGGNTIPNMCKAYSLYAFRSSKLLLLDSFAEAIWSK